MASSNGEPKSSSSVPSYDPPVGSSSSSSSSSDPSSISITYIPNGGTLTVSVVELTLVPHNGLLKGVIPTGSITVDLGTGEPILINYPIADQFISHFFIYD